MTTLSRRQILQLLGAMSVGVTERIFLPGPSRAFAQKVKQLVPDERSAVLFEQVPAETSGIRWRHVNGRSPEYYLPETTGAGCAFLDYDNDGWMDIYLVNSGRCDFYEPNPPLRNALYRNNRDDTFTDVTDKAGVVGGGYGMAPQSATTTA